MKLENLSKGHAIHCPTEELAIKVLTIAHEHGFKWCNGLSFLNNIQYDENLCYNIKDGTCSSYDWSLKVCYTIISAEKFINDNIIMKDTCYRVICNYLKWPYGTILHKTDNGQYATKETKLGDPCIGDIEDALAKGLVEVVIEEDTRTVKMNDILNIIQKYEYNSSIVLNSPYIGVNKYIKSIKSEVLISELNKLLDK